MPCAEARHSQLPSCKDEDVSVTAAEGTEDDSPARKRISVRPTITAVSVE